jgi:hypothetical protein
MNITNAQYKLNTQGEAVIITATIDGVQTDVPVAPGNRHYDEIQRQVEAGDLTISDAD